jgi:fatty-acyl-CoA synthase
MFAKLLAGLDPQRLVDLAFRLRPRSEYVIFRGQRLTRSQVLGRVEALAAGLQSLGVQKGDRVVTLLPGCPEAVFTAFLPSLLGSIHVPLNPLLGERELRDILVDCGARVVVTLQNWQGQDYPATLARLLPDLPELRHIVICDARDGNSPTFLAMKDLLSRGRPLRRARVYANDPVLISYTSGTTSHPKGVVHTQAGYWGVLVRSASQRLDLSPLRCLLLPFPPYHYAGLFGIVATLLAGGKVILMDRFDPQQMLEYIQKESVSQIAGSPTMYRWLLLTPGQERYDLSSVQRITFSTEPISFDLARGLYERLRCNLENFYGTTETMLISWTSLDDPWERAVATVGRPVPGAQIRIVDDERRPLPPGECGEVAVQTSQMMAGYYQDAQMTAQVLDASGWFYTGDVGTVDGEGYLRLLDRKKDLIIRGGENIYPAEVEHYLETHPLVRRASVVGVADDVSGQTVWAYLEPRPGAALTDKEVLNFCRGQIAPYKIPAEVRFVDRLPTTVTNKVQKFKLRDMAAQELAS